MAAPVSTSSTAWRLFGVLCFVLLLAMGYQLYQSGRLREAIAYVTNNYKFENPPRPPRPPVAAPVRTVERLVIYRPAPPSAAQLAALRQALVVDITQQLRRELSRQAPRPAVVAAQRKPPVVALHDTTILKRQPQTGRLEIQTAKTGTFSDPWLSLTGVVKPGKAGRPDSLAVKYQIRNEFQVRAYRQRDGHWWQFRRPKVFVRLKSSNPNSITTGLDSVPVLKRKR